MAKPFPCNFSSILIENLSSKKKHHRNLQYEELKCKDTKSQFTPTNEPERLVNQTKFKPKLISNARYLGGGRGYRELIFEGILKFRDFIVIGL